MKSTLGFVLACISFCKFLIIIFRKPISDLTVSKLTNTSSSLKGKPELMVAIFKSLQSTSLRLNVALPTHSFTSICGA